MTRELFRENAYLRSCRAKIIATNENTVVLDQTVFYPEGGGQPGDSGGLCLDEGPRLEVIDCRYDRGHIVHVLAEDITPPRIGTTLIAELNWARRHIHMRTHTCLHLLCAVIPYDVTGGAISTTKGRLDFDMAENVGKAIVETELERLVAADLAVTHRWISDAEMSAQMDLVRTMSVKPPRGRGRVRLVEVDGVDLQPCGGTHVRRTGEIGTVTLGKVEKKGRQNRRIAVHLK